MNDETVNELPGSPAPTGGYATPYEVTKPPEQATDASKAKRAYRRHVPVVNARSQKRKKGEYWVNGELMSWPQMVAHFQAHPAPLPEDGILAEIVKLLKKAGTKNKPLTKQEVVALLVPKFPDHPAKALGYSVDSHLPTRLAWRYGIQVWRRKRTSGKTEYWIDGTGRKKQPTAKNRRSKFTQVRQ